MIMQTEVSFGRPLQFQLFACFAIKITFYARLGCGVGVSSE